MKRSDPPGDSRAKRSEEQQDSSQSRSGKDAEAKVHPETVKAVEATIQQYRDALFELAKH